jgi:hypothetical protein
MHLLAIWNGNEFIRTKVMRIIWQSFLAELVVNCEQSDGEDNFKYLDSSISSDCEYLRRKL